MNKEKKCPRCSNGTLAIMKPDEINKLVKRLNSTNKIFFNEPILGCDECQYWVEKSLYEN